MSDSEYRKYHEISDRELRNHLETLYEDEYRKGYTITDIVRVRDSWIVKWERVIMTSARGGG